MVTCGLLYMYNTVSGTHNFLTALWELAIRAPASHSVTQHSHLEKVLELVIVNVPITSMIFIPLAWPFTLNSTPDCWTSCAHCASGVDRGAILPVGILTFILDRHSSISVPAWPSRRPCTLRLTPRLLVPGDAFFLIHCKPSLRNHPIFHVNYWQLTLCPKDTSTCSACKIPSLLACCGVE